MHILLLEDEDALRKIYARLLEKAGFSVTAHADGCAEISEQQISQYDIVISDYNMPDMCGKECMERMLSTNPTLRFIFISGTADDQLIKELQDHPRVWAFLPKPVKSATLVETVQSAIHKNDMLTSP